MPYVADLLLKGGSAEDCVGFNVEATKVATYAQELGRTANLLDDILSPMSSNEFIDNYFGKSFLYLSGHRGKFSTLLPWSALNRILEEHKLSPPRLKLFQAGKQIDPDKYTHSPSGPNRRLKAAEFTNLLGQGATLIVDEFDELYRPIRELAVALERIFRVHVQVNTYAGWRTDQGFLLHYDAHDTLILQVAGRKHWQVYKPTRLYPLEQGKDAEPAEKPTADPIWDGMFEDGGLLYIPRGWWHVAYPLDEPTLHLTIGLSNPRGLDLLLWLVNRLSNCAEARQDLPHLCSRTEQQAYLETLRAQFFNAWTGDLMDRYLAASDALALPRPCFELPSAATPDGIAVARKSQVRLVGPRRLNLCDKPENGNLTFKCFGKTLHCCVAVLPILETLNDGQFHSVQELVDLAPDQNANIITFLQVLLLQGILTTMAETDGRCEQVRGGTQ
jgi:ribosomal protein L16 Arg81 hydroxylase